MVSVITVLFCLLIVESVGTIRFHYSPDPLHTSSLSLLKTELGLVAERCIFGALKRKENLNHSFWRSGLSNKPNSEAGLDLDCRLFCAVCGMTKKYFMFTLRVCKKI